jgi:enamine deaminase RidA (YjgF/YER057c/UK114 family)
MVFLIVFVGLFCDAIENGERAQFTDFHRRKSKKASNIDALADIAVLSGIFFDQWTNQICQNCDLAKCDAANCGVTDVIWQTSFSKDKPDFAARASSRSKFPQSKSADVQATHLRSRLEYL